MRTAILILSFLVFAVPATACGDGEYENAKVTPAVKAGLASAYTAAHRTAPAVGPVSGHTWYGRYVDFEYAVATFDGRPRVFTRHGRNAHWLLALDTNGTICSGVVPAELLTRVWWWTHLKGRCYAEPV
jgi:hypothetical protein